jgi:hypothetical protein
MKDFMELIPEERRKFANCLQNNIAKFSSNESVSFY